jgi:CBS domain containing-hemolysin-like protein
MEAFGEFIPQTLLAPSKEKVNSRQRIFSPLVTFWAFLAQVLERGSSCRDALQRVSAWWQMHFPAQGSPSSDTSGYCQARVRLDERVLQQIGVPRLGFSWERGRFSGALFRGNWHVGYGVI